MPTTRSKPPTNEVFQAEDELIPHELMPVRGPWGSRLFATVRAVAQVGGLLLMLIVVLSVVSIVGRKLYSMPVPGDIELLQMGTAVAAAAMLAYCEMLGKHLKVDFFTEKLRTRPRAILDGFAHLLLALVSALVAWRYCRNLQLLLRRNLDGARLAYVAVDCVGRSGSGIAHPGWIV